MSEVVLPIAFAWIEEHKAEVYKDIPTEHREDVGYVIEKAFQIVETLPVYKAGMDQYGTFDKAVEEGSFDPAGANPLWQQMHDAIQEGHDKAKEQFASHFSRTLRR